MRPLFPARTRALHERLNEANMPDVATVEVRERTPDGEGGAIITWVPADTLPCRVSPVGTPGERFQADQLQDFARYVVIFGRKVDVPTTARLRAEVDGEEILLDVHGSNGPRSFEAQRKYECGLWRGSEGP